ncbi:hypothetical protein QTP88_004944 [Uroleucon formosanum]
MIRSRLDEVAKLVWCISTPHSLSLPIFHIISYILFSITLILLKIQCLPLIDSLYLVGLLKMGIKHKFKTEHLS